jgi:hypothetical protein
MVARVKVVPGSIGQFEYDWHAVMCPIKACLWWCFEGCMVSQATHSCTLHG